MNVTFIIINTLIDPADFCILFNGFIHFNLSVVEEELFIFRIRESRNFSQIGFTPKCRFLNRHTVSMSSGSVFGFCVVQLGPNNVNLDVNDAFILWNSF